MKKIYLYCLSALLLSNNLFGQDLERWIKKQYNLSLKHMHKNISVSDAVYKGFVIASPERVKPNYYYHWVRDAALVMRSLDIAYQLDDQRRYFKDYVNIVDKHQTNPHNIEDLGEVKYETNGAAFTGPWGRPQNDGPALRALTLSYYAFDLLASGKPDDKSYVKRYLYRRELPARTAIKRDLEYVSHHWRDQDFDLWEEVKGNHFYTRMAQRTALQVGAKLARELGDDPAAKSYEREAGEIEKELEKHWPGSRSRYILSTINWVSGEQNKPSNLDSSVILAVNQVWIPGQTFSPGDERVIATANELINRFRKIYKINARYKKGVAIGRYPEDEYSPTEGTSMWSMSQKNKFRDVPDEDRNGNPWFLLTNGMAEYFYNMILYYDKEGEIKITSRSVPFFREQLKISVSPGVIKKSSSKYLSIIEALKNEADEYLGRVKIHSDERTGRMDEQLDRDSGFMTGAPELTWSYASFITVARKRLEVLHLKEFKN